MNWFLLLPLWFLVNLAAYLLAPLLPLFAHDADGALDNCNSTGIGPRLPPWLSWFMTPDNSLNGDAGWRSDHCPDWDSYWGHGKWLWRNPACGFEQTVLNAKITPYSRIEFTGDASVQDGPVGKEGFCNTRVDDYWNFVYIKRFGAHCLRFDLGWQLKTFAEQPGRLQSQKTARYAMSIRFPLFREAENG